jgi:NADPH-dependent glutamate synthase beta subunit-like oxidoreductase
MKAYQEDYETPVMIKPRVAVLGGGNVAMDSARTARRLGGEEVTIVYRRSENESPARDAELEHAKEEGIHFRWLTNPSRILGNDGWVSGMECIRMELGESGSDGRRRPIPVEGSEFEMEVDMVIVAFGNRPHPLIPRTTQGLEVTEWGTIAAERGTGQTSLPGVFAGGDCVSGPATLIEAIAAGNKAAWSIDQYLKSGKVTLPEEQVVEDWLHDVAMSRQRDGNIVARKERQSPEQLPLPKRLRGFDEVEQCLTLEMAAREAERCLRCYRVMLLAVDGKK